MRLRKIASVVVVVLTILLIPRGAWVFTFVQHGESPKFPVEKISGSYCITLVGHYTNRDNFAAAGVRTVKPRCLPCAARSWTGSSKSGCGRAARDSTLSMPSETTHSSQIRNQGLQLPPVNAEARSSDDRRDLRQQ